MMFRRVPPLVMLGAALALGPAAPVRAEGLACGAPADALYSAPLPGAGAAVARGHLRVMVVGSASTRSGATSRPEAAWPERFGRVLAARLGEVQVELRIFGDRGSVAEDHSRLLAEHGPAIRPHLIIWQLGTVEAARGLSAQAMGEVVKDTASRIRAARGERTDVVLMDPQFSRFLRANADVETYRDTLRMAAGASGAQVFSRWDIMKYWVETERLDLERAPREVRTRIADELHDCVARALAEFVLAGIRAAR